MVCLCTSCTHQHAIIIHEKLCALNNFIIFIVCKKRKILIFWLVFPSTYTGWLKKTRARNSFNPRESSCKHIITIKVTDWDKRKVLLFIFHLFSEIVVDIPEFWHTFLMLSVAYLRFRSVTIVSFEL